jgi:hypothetical protein
MTERQLEEVIAEIIQGDHQHHPAELESLVLSLLTTSELVNGNNLGQIRKEVRFQIRLHELKAQRNGIAD